MKYQGFEAWIEVEGVRAVEYSVSQTITDVGTTQVAAWISSEVGKV